MKGGYNRGKTLFSGQWTLRYQIRHPFEINIGVHFQGLIIGKNTQHSNFHILRTTQGYMRIFKLFSLNLEMREWKIYGTLVKFSRRAFVFVHKNHANLTHTHICK